jgi:hypothetical protein
VAGEFDAVECPKHGEQDSTFVCRHIVSSLRTGSPVGFIQSVENPEDPRPDAWCSECEKVRIEEGGEWNDQSEAFAGVTLLCGACYDEARELNRA